MTTLHPIDTRTLATVISELQRMENQLLPQLDASIWDLALRYASIAPELIDAQELMDVLEASVRLHLDEDATFALPLIKRLANYERLEEEELDTLPRVMTMLTKRFDQLNGTAAELRELLIHATLPSSAEESREAALDLLDEITLAYQRHNAMEREHLFPQSSILVHDQLTDDLPH